jgi:F-type H+-transporting ATPase subunit epsilon
MPDERVLEVVILSPERLIYQGKAESVVVPGEQGVFEILPYHKRIVSRLLRGKVFVDGKGLPIRRGVVRVAVNEVHLIVEES